MRAGITVTTCGLDDQPVKASRGITIIPDTSIDKVLNQSFDLIVLPGGLPGADHLRDNAQIQTLLKKQSADNKYIAAICAAPKALAQAGVLEGKKATSFPGVLAALNNPNINITENAVEIDGNVVTSRSAGTAMEFALSLIELLEGKIKREEINQQLVR